MSKSQTNYYVWNQLVSVSGIGIDPDDPWIESTLIVHAFLHLCPESGRTWKGNDSITKRTARSTDRGREREYKGERHRESRYKDADKDYGRERRRRSRSLSRDRDRERRQRQGMTTFHFIDFILPG